MKFTNSLFALSLGLLFACGAAEDVSDSDEGDTLGEAAEPFTAPVSDHFQLGTQTGTGQSRCDRTSVGQSCVVADHKTRGYCTNGSGFADGLGVARNTAYAAIQALDAQLSTWSFSVTEYELFQDKCFEGGPGPILGTTEDIHLVKGAVGASGSASNDIKDYVKVTWGPFTGLSEGAGVKGNYQSAFGCNVTIDVADLIAKSAGGLQPAFDRLVTHATQHGVLACLGMGGRTVASGFLASSTRGIVNQAQAFGALTTAEKCVMDGYVAAANGQFNNAIQACPGD